MGLHPGVQQVLKLVDTIMHTGFQYPRGMPCRSYLTIPKLTKVDRSTRPGLLLEAPQVLCTVEQCMHIRGHSGTEGLDPPESRVPSLRERELHGGGGFKATDVEQPVSRGYSVDLVD